MTVSTHHRLIILGSGPAGWSAAIYAARANLNPVVITGIQQGGQLTTTTDVDNWPGDCEGLQGPDLMLRMQKHAEQFETKVVLDHIEEVELKQRPFSLRGSNDYTCDALIIATGASARYLGLPSEQQFMGQGVSACATCDGFFFKEKEVIVIGGGDTAAEEGLFLTRFCKTVTVIHRRDKLRASKIMQDRLFAHPKIEMLWDTTVTEFVGKDRIESVKLMNTKTNEASDMAIEGAFIAIGHVPNTGIFKGLLDTDDEGYLIRHENSMSKIPGVFIAGDVHDHTYRQAVTASAMGCKAAIDCERWLEAEGS